MAKRDLTCDIMQVSKAPHERTTREAPSCPAMQPKKKEVNMIAVKMMAPMPLP